MTSRMTKERAAMYCTAIATFPCYYFNEGDYVSVKYEFTASNGVHWFLCNDKVMYPDHHLTRFGL